jgi:hypothetical protein
MYSNYSIVLTSVTDQNEWNIPFALNQSWEFFFIILVLGTYLKLELNNSVTDNVERQIIMPVRSKICATEIWQACINYMGVKPG